ncbi:related to autophagy protein Atg27 [Cephalotrichum gorgonifer]|uniref:Autophagy-related protein 27 n=1 Tax=Cephalotrichum gorgonifer TaxID=2041049 RepID=A0AAE8SWN7_9PEZI|nr:related to autophagy protein Atg27 [Cephalotrichum gorgonifer]
MQLLSLLAMVAPASAVMLNCEHIRVDKQSFNLQKLGGPHSVVTTLLEPPSHSNTSYTVDICQPLKRKGDVPKEEQCPNGTRVCAIQRTYNGDEDNGVLHKVIPIAGDLLDHGGYDLEYEAQRLKTSSSNADAQREGLRLIIKGGAYPLDGPSKKKTKERAIVEFVCDPELEGTEGEWTPADEYDAGAETARRAAGNLAAAAGLLGARGGDGLSGLREGEEQLVKDGAALKFISFGVEPESEFETLRLEWRTKYACESSYDEERAGRWGFFTWLFIIVFMLTAAYLIFGSWLNYTRFGARGWDLVPHGDTIRDVPYLMKDLVRSAMNTMQGSGSRGGYSAV